jgi:hypothetical protein
LAAGFGLAFALVAATPISARAEDDATIAMARERFKEGVQFFDQKQFDKARAAFLQAYALKRHPAVLLNLAQSELRSDHEADAAKHFSQYLREHKEASEAERQSAEAGLSAAKAELAELTVNVDEEGATVTVDGTTEGQTPLPGSLFLRPGAHSITVRKDGRETTQQVTLGAGQASSATLRLRKSAPPPPRNEQIEPPKPDVAPSEPPVATGEASVEVDTGTSRGREPFFRWAARSPIAWVGGGVAALGLVGGVVFWVGSRNNYADADSIANQIRGQVDKDNTMRPPTMQLSSQGICTRPPTAEYANACRLYVDNADDGDALKNASWLSFGAAATAAAVTVVVYLTTADDSSEAQGATTPRMTTRITPWLSQESQGISLTAEF